MTLNDLQTYLGDKNVRAFLRVIRQGESSQDNDAYSVMVGGAHFADFSHHPFEGQHGRTAAGAYQFVTSTWDGLVRQYGFSDFSPVNQDLACVALIAEKGALADVQAGRLADAIAKCRSTWTSLPGASENNTQWTLERAVAVFQQYGGTLAGTQEQPQPQVQEDTTAATPQGSSMGALALLPLIAQFIPQIATLIKPNSVSTAKDAANAQTILNIVSQVAGVLTAGQQATPSTVATAAEKLAADPALVQQAQQAVVTHPDIMPLLEVGGGVAAARAADVQQQQSTVPFWKGSAVFWMSVIMLPLVYWLVGSLIVGGMVGKLPTDTPWWVKVLLSLFGDGWTGEARSGGFNLVIGLVLGGICGVYYGVSVTQQKQQPSVNTDAEK